MAVLDWESQTGQVVRVRTCPACGEKIKKNVVAHLIKHDPEDFGLSPIGERR